MFPDLPLNNGFSIPPLGFGTWQLEPAVAQTAVEKALEVGFRHIDTADIYGNHHEVGKALKVSGLTRDQVYLTSKVWKDFLTRDEVLSSTSRFLNELQTDYLDLLLIHWPNSQVPLAETLAALDEIRSQGLAKSIGVSNFNIQHLKSALSLGYQFSVNQIEFHPSLSQPDLIAFCQDQRLIVEAYSSLLDLNSPPVQSLAQKIGHSPSQVILNWVMSKGLVALTRSQNPDHIRDNFASLSWQLSPEDIQLLDSLNTENRVVNPPFAEFS